MYKFLLCWRYLRTRYIALVSIVSVMLGVATLIVTNAVMEGFTDEFAKRNNGILADITFESRSLDGVADADAHMREIRRVAGDYIDGMSPTVVVPAILGYSVGKDYRTLQITVVGIDEESYATVSNFGRCLQHPENRRDLDFLLKDGGYDTVDFQADDLALAAQRPAMVNAGWRWRRQLYREHRAAIAPPGSLDGNPFSRRSATTSAKQYVLRAQDPLTASAPEGEDFDPMREQHIGCVLGISIGSFRTSDCVDHFLILPGHDVEITYPSAGKPPKPLSAKFTVVDFCDSKMAEADSTLAFVPIRKLQELRGLIDPSTGVARFNSIQIRLKPGADVKKVCSLLRDNPNFDPFAYAVGTWRDKQAPLLSAIHLEIILLNILLFLIIAVAGFGILAIFLMIVVEKTRDIGVLKSLGASGSGVMGIFLMYGLSLGIVGAGVGTVLGLVFVYYINEIAGGVSWLMNTPVFDRSVYQFEKIPTTIDWLTITLIVSGAMIIAILASILPAWRAARLHPVEALRYE